MLALVARGWAQGLVARAAATALLVVIAAFAPRHADAQAIGTDGLAISPAAGEACAADANAGVTPGGAGRGANPILLAANGQSPTKSLQQSRIRLDAGNAAKNSTPPGAKLVTPTGECVVTMDAAKVVTATFTALPSHLLIVSKTGNGDGTVTSTPAGITCGAVCAASFPGGTAVTLAAAPLTGSVFIGWSGACSGAGACVVTMDASKSVTATFAALPSHLLIVSKTGTGNGTVTSSPPASPAAPTARKLPRRHHRHARDRAADRSIFTGWSGGCSGAGACVVTINASIRHRQLCALPSPAHRLKTGTGAGTVTSTPAGITCGADCAENFADGTTVTLDGTARRDPRSPAGGAPAPAPGPAS